MRWVAVAGMLFISMIFGGHASAQTATCTASSTNVAFGAYQPLSGMSSTSPATVTVSCSSAALLSLMVSYTVNFGAGSGSFAARKLNGTTHPGAALAYQLYTSALYSQTLGDGTAGTTNISDGYLLGVGAIPVTHTYTAYGRIAANQNVAPDTYSDSIVVMLSY